MENFPLLEENYQERKKTIVDVRKVISKYTPPVEPPSLFFKVLKGILIFIFLPLILILLLSISLILFILVITCTLPIIHYILGSIEDSSRKKPNNLLKLDVGGYKCAVAYSDNFTSRNEDDLKVPPIIFLPGVGVPPTSIYYFLGRYFKGIRYCLYDKGSTGESDDIPTTHKWYHKDGDGNADELHAILHHKNFPIKDEKFLIIGGSQGGLIAQYYYYKYPEDVAGIIFIDPSTEDFYTKAPPLIYYGLNFAPTLYSIAPFFAHIGILRLYYYYFVNSQMVKELGVDPEMYQVFFSARNMFGMNIDFTGFSDLCEQTRKIRVGKRIKVPIAVVTGLNWSESVPEYTPIWEKVQYENIATQSDDSIHVILPNDNHGQACLGELDLITQLIHELSKKIQNQINE